MGVHQIFGYAAVISAIITVGTFVTGILFFRKGGNWGWINDSVSVLQLLLMLPLVWAVAGLSRGTFPVLSFIVMVVGIAGLVIPAATQTLLVARVLSFEKSSRIGTPTGLLIGMWLIAANALAVPSIPIGMAICGITAGVGYILLVAGFLAGQQKHPLFGAGSAVALAGYVAWAVWFFVAIFG